MKPDVDDGGRSTDLEKMNKLADQCRKIVGTQEEMVVNCQERVGENGRR